MELVGRAQADRLSPAASEAASHPRAVYRREGKPADNPRGGVGCRIGRCGRAGWLGGHDTRLRARATREMVRENHDTRGDGDTGCSDFAVLSLRMLNICLVRHSVTWVMGVVLAGDSGRGPTQFSPTVATLVRPRPRPTPTAHRWSRSTDEILTVSSRRFFPRTQPVF